jgi:hypothetical protein
MLTITQAYFHAGVNSTDRAVRAGWVRQAMNPASVGPPRRQAFYCIKKLSKIDLCGGVKSSVFWNGGKFKGIPTRVFSLGGDFPDGISSICRQPAEIWWGKETHVPGR